MIKKYVLDIKISVVILRQVAYQGGGWVGEGVGGPGGLAPTISRNRHFY